MLDYIKKTLASNLLLASVNSRYLIPVFVRTWLAKFSLFLGADVKVRNTHGLEPLYVAAEYGYLKVVKILLNNGADIDLENICRDIPLMLAIRNGHIEIVGFLLNNNIYTSCINLGDKLKDSLEWAIEAGQVKIAKFLLDHYDISLIDKNDALKTAIYHRRGEIIKLLLNNGAEVNYLNERETPLSFACDEGRKDAVKILLKHGADVHVKLPAGGSLLKHYIVPSIYYANDSVKFKKKHAECGKLIAGQGFIMDDETKQIAENYRKGYGEELQQLSKNFHKQNAEKQAQKEAADVYNCMRVFSQTVLPADVTSKVFRYVTSDLISDKTLKNLSDSAYGYHKKYEEYSKPEIASTVKRILYFGTKPSTKIKKILREDNKDHIEQKARDTAIGK
jgi:ankyrin repeat protein